MIALKSGTRGAPPWLLGVFTADRSRWEHLETVELCQINRESWTLADWRLAYQTMPPSRRTDLAGWLIALYVGTYERNNEDRLRSPPKACYSVSRKLIKLYLFYDRQEGTMVKEKIESFNDTYFNQVVWPSRVRLGYASQTILQYRRFLKNCRYKHWILFLHYSWNVDVIWLNNYVKGNEYSVVVLLFVKIL